MLVTCHECGGKISRSARYCPHCGYYPDAGYYSVEAQRERAEQQAERETEWEKERPKREEEAKAEIAREAARLKETERRARSAPGRIFLSVILGWVGALFLLSAFVGLSPLTVEGACHWMLYIIVYVLGMVILGGLVIPCVACFATKKGCLSWLFGCLLALAVPTFLFLADAVFETGTLPAAKTTESIIFASITGAVLVVLALIAVDPVLDNIK